MFHAELLGAVSLMIEDIGMLSLDAIDGDTDDRRCQDIDLRTVHEFDDQVLAETIGDALAGHAGDGAGQQILLHRRRRDAGREEVAGIQGRKWNRHGP